MPIKKCFLSPLKVLQLLIFVAAIAYRHQPVNGLEEHPAKRKLDESTTDDQGVNCSPCTQSPPPPPPPSPPPPSPCPPPPERPPPTPKQPPTKYCPPPPPPSFIYITGPPGNLYPIDSDFSGAASSGKIPARLPILIACGVLGLLAFQ